MKIYRQVMAVAFAGFSLIVIRTMANSIAFTIIMITAFGNRKIGIIGANDLPVINLYITPIVLLTLQIIFILLFSVLNIIFSFKYKESRKMRLSLIILLFIIAILHILIPLQSYLTATYNITRWSTYKLIDYLYLYIQYIVFTLTAISLIIYRSKVTTDEN